MNIQLSKITNIDGNTSVAFLFDGIAGLPFGLTSGELALWNNKPEKSETLLIQRLPHFLFLAGPDLSKPGHRVRESFRKAGAAWMETVRKEKIAVISIGGYTETSHTLAFLEGVLLAAYSFSKYKKEKENFVMQEVLIMDQGITETDLEELKWLSEAVWWARDLVNEPFSFFYKVVMFGTCLIGYGR